MSDESAAEKSKKLIEVSPEPPVSIVFADDRAPRTFSGLTQVFEELVQPLLPTLSFEDFKSQKDSPLMEHVLRGKLRRVDWHQGLRNARDQYKAAAERFDAMKVSRRDLVLMALRDAGEDGIGPREILISVGVAGSTVASWVEGSDLFADDLAKKAMVARMCRTEGEKLKEEKRVSAQRAAAARRSKF